MIWPQATIPRLWLKESSHQEPRSLCLMAAWSWCWRYKDRKFHLWSSHDRAGPVFPNLPTSLLLDYKFFRFTFLHIYLSLPLFQNLHQHGVCHLKKQLCHLVRIVFVISILFEVYMQWMFCSYAYWQFVFLRVDSLSPLSIFFTGGFSYWGVRTNYIS